MANPWDFVNVWGVNCDDYPTFDGTNAVQLLTNLDHLEGMEVGIVADGKVLAAQTVTNGQVSLPSSAVLVYVGLLYYSDLETLDIEVGSQTGTSQTVKIKVGNITYRFVNSKGGWIGPNEDNIYEAFTDLLVSRSSTELMFTPEDFTFFGQDMSDPDAYWYTGDLRRSLCAGSKRGGRSFFRQVDPLPVTITAVIPEIEPGGPI